MDRELAKALSLATSGRLRTGNSMVKRPAVPDVPITPQDVPAFPCVVYLGREGGSVIGRVVNLDTGDESADALKVSAASERDVLSKLVPRFKQHVAKLHASGETIPWLDSLPELAPDEVKRFIPIHL